MTYSNPNQKTTNIMTTVEYQELMETKFPKLDVTLLLSKAEGNLKFLASAEMKTFTQGESVLDALQALQIAKKIIHERLSDKTGY